MTAQISDRVFHSKRGFDVAGISGSGLFDPAEHSLKPEGLCSACWRGFHVDYEIRDARLILTSVGIGLNMEDRAAANRGELTLFQGITPSKNIFGFSQFEGLSLPVPYTGGLLLADGFIESLYVHMGFHPAWKFEVVRELIFEDGVLLEDHDRSSEITALREQLASQPLRPDPENRDKLQEWIERCFSRDYFPVRKRNMTPE
jgi:hypothetical protein